MKEKTKAYMAGLLDAEGCLYIGRKEKTNGIVNYGYGLVITNTYRPLMKWLLDTWGGRFKQRAIKTGYRYDWSTTGAKHTLQVLNAINPYLVVKSEQAKLLEEYLNLEGVNNPGAREKLWARSRFLKHCSLDCVTTNTPSASQKKHFGAYAAGMLDGDGSILVTKGRKSGVIWASAGISNADPRVIRLFELRFGGIVRKNFFDKPEHRTCYSWSVTKADEKIKFLLAIIPYLVIKKEKGKIALELTRLDSSEHRRDSQDSVYPSRLKLFELAKIESDLTRNRKSALPVMATA